MLHGVGLYRTLVHWFNIRPQLQHYWAFVYEQADNLMLCRADACFWFSSLYIVPVLTAGGLTWFIMMRALSLFVALVFLGIAFLSSIALAVRLTWQRFPADALAFKRGVIDRNPKVKSA